MSSANLPVPQQPEQAPLQDEALLEIDFSFDLAPVVEHWKDMETEEKKPLVMDQMPVEFPRFTLKVDGKPLNLPEEDRRVTDYFGDLILRNPEFASLLKKSSDFIYFFAQHTGIKLSCANAYAFPIFGEEDKVYLTPSGVPREALGRQIEASLEEKENSERAIVLRCTSGKRGQGYGFTNDPEKVALILSADESTWRLPLDAEGKLTGKAIVRGTLLLQNPEGQSSDEFRRIINLQTTRTHHAIEELTQLGSGEVEVKKRSTFFSPPAPPTKASRVAWPALLATAMAGLAVVLTVALVIPPLGLGLAGLGVMAAIGGLIGMGVGLVVNAYKKHQHSKEVKEYDALLRQKKDALLFGPANPVINVSLDGPAPPGGAEQGQSRSAPEGGSNLTLPAPTDRRDSDGSSSASPTVV